MNVPISDGLNVISIGYSGLGSYYRLKRPVSLLWSDCAGSVGQFLSLLPSSPAEREVLHRRINANLFEDFTGREEKLYEVLKPLFRLFQNGQYTLTFDNGTIKQVAQISSGSEIRTYEMKWYTVYPEPVDLSKINEIKKDYERYRHDNGLKQYGYDLVGYTSKSIYDWENSFYIATRPQSEIDHQRVAFFREKIEKGERPFVIMVRAFYGPEYEYSGDFILDGHHKLEAYMELNIDPPMAIITRTFNSVEEPEFDIESLGSLLYPWQVRHILDNWDAKDEQLPKLLQNPDSRLAEFVRHGDHKEYHDNGKIKLKGSFIYDSPEGLILEYYDSGRQKSEKNYHGGKQVGIWKYWLPSGQLRSIQSFNANGQLHGESVSYDTYGGIQSKMNYSDGLQADGYSYGKYGHTGKIDYEFWHKDGMLVEKKSYSDDGGLLQHQRFSTELGQLVDVPVPDKLKYPGVSQNKQSESSFLTIRAVIILVCLLGLMLLKCLS